MELKIVVLGLALLLAHSGVSAQELIVNGSFEANSAGSSFVMLSSGLTGWTVSNQIDLVNIAVFSPATDGVNWIDLTTATAGSISQTFPTITSETYRLCFDYGNYGPRLRFRNDDLRVELLSGSALLQAFDYRTPPPSPQPPRESCLSTMEWQPRVCATFTAASVATTVKFLNPGNADGHAGCAGGVALDNISVVPTPIAQNPSVRCSQVELCWESVSNKIYQVQYQSDLTTNFWIDLGTPIQGNGTTSCTVDAVAPGQPQKFYRIVRLP